MKAAGATATLALAVLCGLRLWQRWGPVGERPTPERVVVRQWSGTTCGPAAVATVLNVYGRPWSREGLERDCRLTPSGTSLQDLRSALQRHGLEAEGLRARSPQAMQRIPRPFIAHMAKGHFTVVRSYRDGRFDVVDPSWERPQRLTAAELYSRGRGWVLAVHD